eukprot:TRINITY_DN11854_c0_g1_i3.p1 TRINITY_DN11854_c0_g1~~TRINITY_DN11854_c0_g1_i3.p1  ORF type:complete len:418 (-),score=74.20 TRINITY_DN11854_c0_g1_i3:103-1356(-)
MMNLVRSCFFLVASLRCVHAADPSPEGTSSGTPSNASSRSSVYPPTGEHATRLSKSHEMYPPFDEYLKRFGKSYDPDSYAKHKEIYDRRIVQIMEHNSNAGKSWTEKVNKFTDTAAPKASAMARRKRESVPEEFHEVDIDALPSMVDWRTHQPPVITPARDQGNCGDCWAISATKAVESHLAIASGELMKLSTQRVADCASTGNTRHNCNFGGYADDALLHAKRHGIPLAEHYPRLNTGAECNLGVQPAAGVAGHKWPRSNNAKAFMRALEQGPVSIGVESNWESYHSGIFSGCSKRRSALDHQVLLAGYGEENGEKYWLVQNSWGTDWGENGYIRLKRYDEEPCLKDTYDPAFTNCGECGLLAEGIYPTGAFKHSRRLNATDSVTSAASCSYFDGYVFLLIGSLLPASSWLTDSAR